MDEERTMNITCPSCGASMPSEAAFCDQCGTRLPRREPGAPAADMGVRCQNCGTPAGPGQVYCEQCGASLAPSPAQAPAPPASAPAPSASAPALQACPSCGAAIAPGERFCTSCGLQLAPAPEPAAPPAPPVQSAPLGPAPAQPQHGTRLVMANGVSLPLPPQPEVIVGREDPLTDQFPDIDLTPFGASEQGVSRRHARLVREGNHYFIEDLESTNHTFVNQQRVMPGERQQLQAGDQVRFGRVAATFQPGEGA